MNLNISLVGIDTDQSYIRVNHIETKQLSGMI